MTGGGRRTPQTGTTMVSTHHPSHVPSIQKCLHAGAYICCIALHKQSPFPERFACCRLGPSVVKHRVGCWSSSYFRAVQPLSEILGDGTSQSKPPFQVLTTSWPRCGLAHKGHLSFGFLQRAGQRFFSFTLLTRLFISKSVLTSAGIIWCTGPDGHWRALRAESEILPLSFLPHTISPGR